MARTPAASGFGTLPILKRGTLVTKDLPKPKDVNKNVYDAIQGFKTLLELAKSVKETRIIAETRVTELHPSSFPFCPMHYAMEYIQHDDVFEQEQESLAGNYFTGIGTVVHAVMQNAISQAHLQLPKSLDHYLIGDYKCRSCGHTHKFSVYPRKCKGCKIKPKLGFEYEELAVWWGKNIVGHSDGLYKFKGKYFVIDYKTTSSFAVAEHRKTGKHFPYSYNVKQIKSYCALFEENYNIKIEGWMLIYIPRDNYHDYEIVGDDISEKQKKRVKKQMDYYDRTFGQVRSLKALRSRKKILMLLNSLWEEKVCNDKKDYEKKMKDTYFECPFGEEGICFNKRLMQKQFDVVLNTSALYKGIKLLK